MDRLYDHGVFTSKGEVVREALRIARTLQKEAAHGYTEVLVRNSQRHERVLVIPCLIEESEADPTRKPKRLKTNARAHQSNA